MEEYAFIGTPDSIFPYEEGTICRVSLRRVFVSVQATIHTPDFKCYEIPYRSMRKFCENWSKVIRVSFNSDEQLVDADGCIIE